MRISDWSSDVGSADLDRPLPRLLQWPTAALEPGRANPGPGLLRRSAAAGGGMKTTAVCGPRSGWATPSLREARKRQRTTEPAGDPLIRRRTLSERSRPPLSWPAGRYVAVRSEETTSELQSLMRISYDCFCLKKKKRQ